MPWERTDVSEQKSEIRSARRQQKREHDRAVPVAPAIRAGKKFGCGSRTQPSSTALSHAHGGAPGTTGDDVAARVRLGARRNWRCCCANKARHCQ